MTDLIVFLRRFISAPKRVGSVIPSSRFLCARMMREVDWASAQTIVELGPGTGVFTKAILQQKRPDATFFVVERDPQFQEMLRSRFPGLTIYEEAVHLSGYLREMNAGKSDAIISGLPFAIFPEEQRSRILDEVVASLAPGGVFITFQYSLQLKNELQQRFRRVSIGFTPLNIPPAFIYTCHN